MDSQLLLAHFHGALLPIDVTIFSISTPPRHSICSEAGFLKADVW